MLARDDPPIYLVFINYAGTRESIAWAARDRAIRYVEDRIQEDVRWEGSIRSGDSRMVAYDTGGEMVARVARIPIADPVTLQNTLEKWEPGPVFANGFEPIASE